MAVSDGHQIMVYKEMGLVSQVFTEGVLASLQGHVAIGHCRYSTTGSSVWENAQPTFRSTGHGPPGAGPQRQPDQHPRAGDPGRGCRVPVRRPAAGHPDALHLRHRAAQRAAGRAPGRVDADGRRRRAAARARGLQPGLHGRQHAVRRTGPAGHPSPGDRPVGARRLDRGLGVRGPGHRRCDVRARGRARRGHRHRRARAAERPVRPRRAEGLPVRVRLPGPTGHPDLRSQRARHPRGDRPHAVPRAPRRGRPGHPHARVRDAGRGRVRPGQRHPVRAGPGEERLRRAHVHPALADHPAAGHPAEAEPPARRHRGQAPRGRRRLDRPGQHPAGHRADAARVRGGARCMCGSPARRCCGPASTGSTSRRAPS